MLQQWVDSAIILAIVLGSTLLGFFQEYRASAAVEQLKRRLALTCRVMRDGVERTVPVSTVVPGDLILLSAGNLIPADGLVIEAEDFLVSEASMTGESFPVEKQPGTVKPEAGLSARTNAVFLGASVQSGVAKVLVVETGLRTVFGAIAARLRTRQPETDFGRGVRQFGYLLIRAMVVIVLFVLTVNLLLGRPAFLANQWHKANIGDVFRLKLVFRKPRDANKLLGALVLTDGNYQPATKFQLLLQ